jgi:hypothetical protein
MTMKIRGLTALALALGIGALGSIALPQPAHADVEFSVNTGPGYYPHHEYRRGYYYPPSYGVYPAYPGYPVYAAPAYVSPPVVYAPPASSTVIVTPQQPVVATAPAPVQAAQPSSTFTNDAGQTCREYQSTITVGNQQQQAYGTACLQPDGTWRVVH